MLSFKVNFLEKLSKKKIQNYFKISIHDYLILMKQIKRGFILDGWKSKESMPPYLFS